MASAYRYADDGGRVPSEIEILSAVDRFGAASVFGRPIGAGEIRRMNVSESIIRAYRERERAENWAEWARDNRTMAALLAQAAKAADDGE